MERWCFVFDYRVSVEHGLEVGHYVKPPGIPISKEDKQDMIMLRAKL